MRCVCMREADERKRAEQAREISDLGEQHAECTFANFVPGENVAAGDAAEQWTEGRFPWLVLWGDKGIGKTHLLAASFHAHIEAGRVPCYTVYPDLLDYIRGGIKTGQYGERFKRVKESPILLLDDVGAETRSRWTDEALFKLLDHRYRHRMPTVIASNLCPDELEGRVASRLQDVSLSVVIQMVGSDVRPFNERAGEGVAR